MRKTVVVLSVLALVLLGCGPTGPLRADDPQVVRLRNYAATRNLTWDITMGASGTSYCVSAYKAPYSSDLHSYHIECGWFLGSTVSDLIDDYEKDKPGYFEGWQNRPLAQGGSK